MSTEYYTDENGNDKSAEFYHYDGTRHALLIATIREAEERTYNAPRHAKTPEEKAEARAIWQTLNYLTQIIDELEYTDNEHIQRAAAYEEATDANEHAYNYHTAQMTESSAEEEYNAREAQDEAKRKAAEYVLKEARPYNEDIRRTAGKYYRFTYTHEAPYTKPMD